MSDHHRNGGSGHGDNTRPEAPIEDYMNELESNFSQDKLNAARQAFHEACDSKTVDEKLSQQFAYAKLLISSPKKDHIVEGLGLMAELCRSSLYMTDALFFRSLGHYRIGEYRKCKDMIVELLRVDPLHKQGCQMHEFYQVKMQQRGLYGLLITGSVVLLSLGIYWWCRRSTDHDTSASHEHSRYSSHRYPLHEKRGFGRFFNHSNRR